MSIKREVMQILSILFVVPPVVSVSSAAMAGITLNQDLNSISNVSFQLPNNGGSVFAQLTPYQVGLISSPGTSFQDTVKQKFPDWTFDFVGSGVMKGTFDINQYDAQKAAPLGAMQAGAILDAEYTPDATDPPVNSLHYIQYVSDTTDGQFIDGAGRKAGAIAPWYFTEGEEAKQHVGGVYEFLDTPLLPPPPPVPAGGILTGTATLFELYLVEDLGNKTAIIYDGFDWGFYQHRYPPDQMSTQSTPADITVTPEPGLAVLLLSSLPFLAAFARSRR